MCGNFKHTTINAGDYCLKRGVSWQRQLPENLVNVFNLCVLSDCDERPLLLNPVCQKSSINTKVRNHSV